MAERTVRADSLTEPADLRDEYATAIASSQPDWDRMAAHSNAGTPYDISEHELRVLQDAQLAPEDADWRALPDAVPVTQAHTLLKHFATQRLTWAQMAARQRLVDAHRSPHGTRTPGLLIKMINDLDTLLFGDVLRNRILVHWVNMAVYIRKLQAHRKPKEQPLPTVLATTVVPPKRFAGSIRPAIYLSAEIMCYASESKVQPLAVLIHEMLHAYLYIMAGMKVEASCDSDDDLGVALTQHDSMFEASCDVLAARLGASFLKLSGKEILRYYDGPNTLVQLREVEKREHVRLQDGLTHLLLPSHMMPRPRLSMAPALTH
ncbi:hypothetical protein LTR62_003756 [Meristemomyces frigidus]|uniref:SprT-like domain-containing protein n=1 Tax=Meristemomyces frigidus TaxID=1508187 RepID=A0AAN7TEH9_9PEZI|nr:hypothetical protein LTR62_003756 [Meristemomyces frigidus]